MNKKGKCLTIFLICLCALLAIAIIVFLVLMLKTNLNLPKFSFNVPSGRVSENIVLDEKYDEIIGNINFDIESGELEINNSKTEEISVKIYADKEYIKEYTVNNNDDLNIKVKGKNCIGFCFKNIIPKIVLTLPSKYDKTIVINSDYGNVKVESFENTNLISTLSAGNIEIEKVYSVSIENDAGNVKINRANKVTVKESAGNVKIKSVNDVEIENDYGNIEIENVNKYMNLNSDCGNIKVTNVNITKDSKIKCDLGNITIKNISNVFIDAKTDLGDLKVNNNDRKSDITLTIKNDCGDIKVNN